MTELVITIRKVSDMGSTVTTNIAPGKSPIPAAMTAYTARITLRTTAPVIVTQIWKASPIRLKVRLKIRLKANGRYYPTLYNDAHIGDATARDAADSAVTDATKSMNSGTHLKTTGSLP